MARIVSMLGEYTPDEDKLREDVENPYNPGSWIDFGSQWGQGMAEALGHHEGSFDTSDAKCLVPEDPNAPMSDLRNPTAWMWTCGFQGMYYRRNYDGSVTVMDPNAPNRGFTYDFDANGKPVPRPVETGVILSADSSKPNTPPALSKGNGGGGAVLVAGVAAAGLGALAWWLGWI